MNNLTSIEVAKIRFSLKWNNQNIYFWRFCWTQELAFLILRYLRINFSTPHKCHGSFKLLILTEIVFTKRKFFQLTKKICKVTKKDANMYDPHHNRFAASLVKNKSGNFLIKLQERLWTKLNKIEIREFWTTTTTTMVVFFSSCLLKNLLVRVKKKWRENDSFRIFINYNY